MKVLVLALLLTLVGCQQLNKQPVFNQNKCYTYKYEFTQLTRVPAERQSGAGIKLSCKAEICGSRPGLYLMRMFDTDVFEYNSNSPVPEFIPSPKLTKSIAAQLGKRVAFQSENGRIKKIMASANHSVDSVNLYRGFLNNMQPIIKDKQREYTLLEDGIEGHCNTTYIIPDSEAANRMLVMKSKNLNDCPIRVEKAVGTTYATPCAECKENSQAAITSSYYIKPTQDGPVIDQVIVSEIHRYMPFDEINGGSIVMEASQNIQLIKEEEHRPEPLPANFKDYGSLTFQFSDESEHFSTPVKQLERLILDDLQYLTQQRWEKISEDSIKKFQQLTQFMHKADYEVYDTVYKKCSGQPECRRHFWDAAVSANNPYAIRLLKNEYEKQEITDMEAAQIMLVGFHSISPSLRLIEEAKSFLTEVHKHPHGYLFRTSFLAYATLCHKYCIALSICPESVLKPLNDFANEVLSRPKDDDIILLLRSYENVRHPSIMKPFMKFLPGSGQSDLPLLVQQAFVRCLKGFAKKHPTWVRRTSMQIYQNRKLPDSTRILAAWSLLSTKPDLPVLMILAKSLAYERSAQVEYFVISSLSMLATSSASDLQAVAFACRMVLNIVRSKYEQPKYAVGKFFIFTKESIMAGMKAEVFILNTAGSMLPNFMSAKFETKFLGNRFSPFEMGLGIPYLSEILGKRRYEADSDNDRSVDARKLLKMRSGQKMMPREAPRVGGYVQMFDQNIFVGSADSKAIVEALQELYRPERRDSWITNFTYSLQKGVAIQWVKSLTSVDASYAVAVCTGLPLERSLTHFAITTLAGSAKAWFTPDLPQNRILSKLNPADVRLETKLSFSIDKRMIFRMGIRNSLLLAGLEEYGKLTVNLPINAAVDVNLRNKNFKLEIPPCKEETHIFSLSTKTYAVVGNGEEAPATKSTPVLPPQTVPKIINWDFKPDSVQENKLKERRYSAGSSYLTGQSAHHLTPVLQDVCLNASTFGYKACIKYSGVPAGLGNDILNRFLGEHNIACIIYPVHSETPVEKIQVTVQLDNLTAVYGHGDQTTDDQTKKSKNRAQWNLKKMDSSSERTSSSSSRITDEDENSKERPLDGFGGHEAQSGQHTKHHSKSPKKSQSSSSSRSSKRSSSESSSSVSSETSESNTRSSDSSSSSENRRRRSSSSSSSSDSRSSRSSSESEQQKGRQESRRHGRMSSSDYSDHGDADRRHNRTLGKQQTSSSSSSSSSSESDWSHQDEKRKSNQFIVKSGKTSHKDRTQYNSNDSSERGGTQKERSRSSSSSDSSSINKDGSSSESRSRSSSESSSKSSSESGCSSSESGCNSRKRHRNSRENNCSSGKCNSHSSSSSSSSRRSSRSSRSSDSSSSEETDFLRKKASTKLIFAAQAVKSNNEKQGYQATVFVNHKDNKLDMQLVMAKTVMAKTAKIGCLYVHVWPYEAQASLNMGKQCQDKKLEIKVSKGHLATSPAIQLKIKSKKFAPITLWLKRFLSKSYLISSRSEEFLPSLASYFDFNSIRQKNPCDEIVLRMAASSPQSVSVICKLPGETLYMEDVNVPWPTVISPPQHHPSKEMTAFNFLPELASRMLREDEAVCQVDETSIRNFANTRFNGAFNENCRTLIAQECTENPLFSIITRKPKLDLPRELDILLSTVNITISPAPNSSLLVSYNGEPMDKDVYEDDKEDIRIYRNESVVCIQASHYGLENVTYDSKTIWVTVSSKMRGKTCGLCGSNDGEKRNEGRMPNLELAHSDMAFFHSWLLEDSDCVTDLNPEMEDISQSAQQYSR
ncbi:vitellogenin-1-like [Sphaerodactylus townsendi]|uniref:vitellogenin-1-like n=1 Tax=Sphaerodactylus townsendi TaxID=933632 RepID=UPI002026481C|nr:vitellogenin-1-like [Sphaerodactylus townsendi]